MSVAAPQADLVGAILSRKYTLRRLLGVGAMGSVYEAQSALDGRTVAIKLLGVEHLQDDEIKARFADEGRACERLIHPNIVRVFEVGDAEDGTPYIVMEMLDGVPLSAYTRAGVRVPLGSAASILQGILSGLGAAHAQGIVHRDLKPENVFLAREPGGTFVAKLLDFGIAKVMEAAGGMGSKTKTGALLGTPAYMSPEQIKNAKDVDARSDLWSAGVLLYEMLTGRVAFPAPTEYARLAAVLHTTPAPVESVDPQLARVSAFVQLAMQKDRGTRFQTALEMARALASAAGTNNDGVADGTAAGPAGPGGAPMPLSRLPDVPSVWMAGEKVPAPGSASPHFPTPMPPATTATPEPALSPSKGPSGTLASRMGADVKDPASPPVVMAPAKAAQGTLPSENLPMFAAGGLLTGGAGGASRGVAPLLVAIFVLVALAVGFGLGFATARIL